MRTPTVLALIAFAIVAGGCPSGDNRPSSVPYPHNNNVSIDTTKPTLTIKAFTQSATKTASATELAAGQVSTPVFGGVLDMAHLTADSVPVHDERSLVLSYSATDPETGIQRVRLAGRLRVCSADGREVDYQGSHVYDAKDFTANNATTVPVTAGNTLNVSIFELMHPLKNPADPAQGRKDGTDATFSFFLETMSGAGTLINFTPALVYTVGTVACPLP